MATAATRATLDDLYGVEGKAELIGGRIVRYMASGHLPSLVSLNVFMSLRSYVKALGRGHAYADGLGYAIPELPSGRESFQPDASCHFLPLPANPMRFVEGPPTFAVEVRSENDYGPAAEAEMASKRDDYFAAGTLVVWDVDPDAETVTSYRRADPLHPTVFKRGDMADAEPAVPGWRMALDDVFAR